MSLAAQTVWLFLLAVPIACVSWTATHEEIFREPRDFCKRESERAHSFLRRKCFYVFTCEYCFSHYVTIFFLAVTRYKLLLPNWRGYLLSFFALVWIANLYMNIYARLRLDVTHERIEIKSQEKKLSKREAA
ncbi:MAG TPA: hypothetical protein VMT53_22525 [Terriglobales bacterium]|nr:hypothetical protein [Terriglobales bacterium]